MRDDDERALNALRRIVQALRVSSRASERAVGMSTAQLFVLRQIEDAGACSIGELAARTRTHASSVSVVVTRLVAAGLVERHESAEDRRRVVVTCTDAGRRRLADGPAQPQDRLIAALAAMDPAARAALADGLDHLAASVAADGEVPMFFDGDPPVSEGTPGGRS